MLKSKGFYSLEELEAFIETNNKEQELIQSFHAFVKAAWPVIEGSKPFMDSWHIGAICEHLEALHRLEIRKLIINVPPRSSKSTISTIMWPVWTWLHDPSLQYFCLSHSDDLATRHGVLSRDIITSPWFKEKWGNLFTIKQDQNNKHMYVNNKTGFRESCGILAKITGKGGTRVICLDYDAFIFTNIGYIKIGEIVENAIDCLVLSYNHITNSLEFKEIEAHERNSGDFLVEIDLGDRVITCTAEHPVYVEGKGYIRADSVKKGDVLLCL